MRILLLLCLVFSLLPQAQAKRFANQYTEFELPMGWECDLEGAEYVCQSTSADRKKEAIIILAAKLRGEQDDLENYQAYLKAAKTFALPGGKNQVSEPKYARATEINGQRWIDALHLASEVPGFYTRYLATVKEDLGIAVTFSVAKDNYDSYKGVFDKVIATLRVFRQKQVDLSKLKARASGNDDLIDKVIFNSDDDPNLAYNQGKTTQTKKASGDDMMLYIIVGIALVVAFFIIKNKKKK